MTGNESYLAGAILIDAASVLPVIQGLVKPDDFQIEAYRTVVHRRRFPGGGR